MTKNTRWARWACIAICGQAGMAAPVPAKPLRHLAGDEAREVAFLVGRGTADSLATASLLTHLLEPGNADPGTPDAAALMQRAAALAPRRPEILWLLLRDCQIRHCGEEQDVVARLRAIDPDNGLPLLSALAASQGGPATETTRILAQIGAGTTLRLYWNKTLVMMFDALTHDRHAPPATALTLGADDRLTHAAGVLSAVTIPPLKPIAAVCDSDQLQEAQRRSACEGVMARLDASDAIIAQSLSVSVQVKWWSAGSSEVTALHARRLQQEYLVQEAGRVRAGRLDADAELRVAALRQTLTEEDAAKATLTALHEPLQRPADWRGPSRLNGS